MAPAWDSLAQEFEQSKEVVIGDVDCTVESELCQEYGVQGYPTIKYFTSSTAPKGDSYSGGRELNDLRSFTEEKLGSAAGCDPKTGDGCDDRETKFIAKMKTASATELAEQAARLEKMKGEKMAPELGKWVRARLSIIKQLSEKDEL